MQLADRLKRLGTETAFAVSVQAARWASQGNKVYPFHLGDMNISTPANVVQAASKAIADGRTGYSPAAGIATLREALAHDVSHRRGVIYGPENVSIQPGGKPLISKFISAVMNSGDEVLYPNPGYPIYESQIEFQGGVAVPYGYVQTDEGFAIDLDKLHDSITDKTRILIYNNYQNPISAESTEDEMKSLAELALKCDLWVLSDEAYFEIRYGGEPHSIVALPGMMERTVILYTFSKKFAMTGWRLGAGVGPEKVINVITKLNTNHESCSNHFIQWAMVEGIDGDQSGPKRILEILKDRRNAAVDGLNAIYGIDIALPNSTFYLFPKVTEIMERKGFTEIGELQTEALHKTGISFCTRNHFGRPLPDERDYYIRFAYSGIDVEDIVQGLGRLKEYFET
ncbi:MAG: aminotransferase class I/II-fold pyridoxal phosphate-dependent enzyme [Candidatus Marinimicrobia bacterium]|nr:aspartate aminotransferase [Candidatus Neomarinimicrobiota bacterium]MDP6456087.1 aminotransferase class I/II-fold pyridoxal phosphate-dependent enzyme [Candidatus Neomarinimicrobiota bacterium]MDP6592871.1 aminotransferase class I/II-fold pyridoxal phosphate-dependent enzyme [Candidatus Neomarinimicrobiota bacterium]MDP6836144.1 aminotransferase class I/II-fold pyridoxal phosphate-dependent enzyme [Candidatus Neomarinimicrobiota bacterium]MDP6966397.1 aminotransferase class I/II-fold pyrido